MTNEKMLSLMSEILTNVPSETTAGTIATCAITELKEDIRRECQKRKGNGKRDVLIRKVMKNVRGDRAWAHCYEPVDDMFGFLDGYRAYVLRDNYGYEGDKSETPFNIKDSRPKEATIKVPVDVSDVDYFIRKNKAEMGRFWNPKKNPYVLRNGDFEISFNPIYLLEFCQMFNTDYLMCSAPLAPAQYEAENGEWGILCPVRPMEV